MLGKVRSLKNYKLFDRTGVLGKIEEFYFDDNHWTIRYWAAGMGKLLSGREVTISPYELAGVNKEKHRITVDLDEEQMEEHLPARDGLAGLRLHYELQDCWIDEMTGR
jgi:hypothetical protein